MCSTVSLLCIFVSASQHVSSNFQKVFRPTLGMFDILIHLDPKQLPRKHEHLDYPDNGPKLSYGKSENFGKMPVTDFDPAALYVKDLRVSFFSSLWLFYMNFDVPYKCNLL